MYLYITQCFVQRMTESLLREVNSNEESHVNENEESQVEEPCSLEWLDTVNEVHYM